MDFEEWMNRNYSGAFDMPHQREAYEAGQQSKQAEIEALKNKMQTALNKACMLQNSSGERIYAEIKELLK